MTSLDLNSLTIPQLKEYAKQNGIKGYSGMNKSQLISYLAGSTVKSPRTTSPRKTSPRTISTSPRAVSPRALSKTPRVTAFGEEYTRKRKKKDPNAPKRALNAYMFYVIENRGRIKSENPNAKVTEIARIAGTEWRTMTPEQREPYQRMSDQDKSRYEREIAVYKG